MSRVIKFRVWDTRTNAYRHHCNERLSFISGPGTHSLGRFEFASAELFKNQDSIHEQEFVSPYFNGPVLIPEQFTGLLDKTGHEVYEGDIVRFTTKVELGDGEINVGVISYDPEFMMFQLDKHGQCMLDGVVVRRSIEVIGNRHEDPHLIP